MGQGEASSRQWLGIAYFADPMIRNGSGVASLDRDEGMKGLIAAVPAKTLAARLREILPEIDLRVRAGVRHEEIVAALAANGLVMSLNTFRTYLHRWRKTAQADAHEGSPPAAASASHSPLGVTANSIRPAVNRSAPDRPDLDAVLDRGTRDEIGEKYLARGRPLFKAKGDGEA